jgi:hypothetical protein
MLCNHFFLSRKAALDQFIEGLEMGGLLQYIRESPKSLKKLFVYSKTKLTTNEFQSLFKTRYSPEGSNKRDAEEQSALWWYDFLEELDDPSAIGETKITLEDLLTLVTGANKIPPCGFQKDLEICFYEAYEDSKDGSGRACS